MSAYLPTTRSNPCPVCGDTKGKCRTFADSNNVLCLENAGVGIGAIINGYYCIGDTSDHRCGKFVPEEERLQSQQQWSEQQRQEWIAKRKRLEEQRREQEESRRQECLPVAERDRLYRQLLGELTLHPADRADLLRRGYSEEKIQANSYKSVEKWQHLSREYDIRLPGVQLNGRSLNIPYPGYLCPVRDLNGCITSLQIRNRNPNAKRDGEPKYYWLTSKTKKRLNGPTAHLYPEGSDSGELPLAILRPNPNGTPIGITLVEGTGPKPDLASQRLDAIVVGAAGGLWDASPVTLKQTLDALFQENPHLRREVVLCPDGGDVTNYHCMERDRRVYELLTSLGYPVKIAWWGQIPKGNDIDELEDLSLIRAISWEEFWEIGLSNCPKLREKAYSEGEFGVGSGEKIAPPHPAPCSSAQEERTERAYHLYKQYDQLTVEPWMVIDQPQFPDLSTLDLPFGIYALKGYKGSGKTIATKGLIDKAPRANYLTHRVTLAMNAGQRLELNCDPQNHWATHNSGCINSITKSQFSPLHLIQPASVVFVDESPEVGTHLFGSTCNKGGKRPTLLNAFKGNVSISAKNGYCLTASEDLTDAEIQYLEKMSGQPVKVIAQSEQVRPPGYPLLKFATLESAIAYTLHQVAGGKKAIVLDDFKDGKKGSKSFAQMAWELNPRLRIVEINSDTSNTPAIQDLIAKFDELSVQYDLICVTSSVISGLSCTNDHFDLVAAFINGVCLPNQVSQFLKRVRDHKIPRILYVAQQAPPFFQKARGALTPEEVDTWYKQNFLDNLTLLSSMGLKYTDNEIEFTDPEHWEYFCQQVARDNCARLNLARLTYEKLESEGNHIQDIPNNPQILRELIPHWVGRKAVKDSQALSWSVIEQANAQRIEQVEPLDDETFEAIANGEMEMGNDDIPRFQKTLLLKRYGPELIEKVGGFAGKPDSNKPFEVGIVRLDRKGRFAGQLNNLRMLRKVTSGDATFAAKGDRDSFYSQYEHGLGVFLGDLTHNTLKIDLLAKLGIHEFLDRRSPEDTWNYKDARPLEEKIQKESGLFQRLFGDFAVKVRGNQLIGQFLQLLGISTLRHQQTNPQTNKRISCYQIDPQFWELFELFDAYRESLSIAAMEARNQELPRPGVGESGVGEQAIFSLLPTPHSSAQQKTPLQFCLEQLQRLETDDSSSIASSDELVELFNEVGRQELEVGSLLPPDYWNRFATALGRVSQRIDTQEEAEVQWAQRALADLEAIARGESRGQFSTVDAAIAAFERFERLSEAVLARLYRLVQPQQFWERVASAIAIASQLLPDTC